MAIAVTSIAKYDNSTLANFLSWSKWMSDQMDAVFGWIQTADSGQVDWANTTVPPSNMSNDTQAYVFKGAYNAGTAYTIGNIVTSGGVTYFCIAASTGNAPPNTTFWHVLCYEIWKSNDANFTMYMKIEFGVGGTVNAPAFSMTFGTGSDGQGNLTGNVSPRLIHRPGPTADAVNNHLINFAGDVNWLSLVFMRDLNTDACMAFTLDRSRDSSGNMTNTYFTKTMVYNDGFANTSKTRTQIIQNPSVGAALSEETRLNFLATSLNSGNMLGSCVYCPFFPLYGKMDNPSLAWGVVVLNDGSEGGIATVNLYGVDHSMLMTRGSAGPTIVNGVQQSINSVTSNAWLLVRYE